MDLMNLNIKNAKVIHDWGKECLETGTILSGIKRVTATENNYNCYVSDGCDHKLRTRYKLIFSTKDKKKIEKWMK